MAEISTWGKGEELTLNKIEEEAIKGKWLDLGAGDGRYIPELLQKIDELVLGDIDAHEIEKAQKSLSEEQKEKIRIKIFDITTKFPFENSTFDGVFCTGTLHLFTKDKLNFIFQEISRILKSQGKLIIDFATDVKRILPNGEEALLKDRPDYSLIWKKNEVKEMLKEMLKDYDLEFGESVFSDDLTKDPEYGFVTKGNFFLVIGNKK